MREKKSKQVLSAVAARLCVLTLPGSDRNSVQLAPRAATLIRSRPASSENVLVRFRPMSDRLSLIWEWCRLEGEGNAFETWVRGLDSWMVGPIIDCSSGTLS